MVPVMPDKFQVSPVRFEAKKRETCRSKGKKQDEKLSSHAENTVASTSSDVVWKDSDTEGTF